MKNWRVLAGQAFGGTGHKKTSDAGATTSPAISLVLRKKYSP
jgi:hypothetical protein